MSLEPKSPSFFFTIVQCSFQGQGPYHSSFICFLVYKRLDVSRELPGISAFRVTGGASSGQTWFSVVGAASQPLLTPPFHPL